MIVLLPMLLQISPSPPPLPKLVPDPGAYVASCTARAESGATFPVSFGAKGLGKSRRVVIRSGRPDLLPSGKFRPREVKEHELGRMTEGVEVSRQGGALISATHHFHAGKPTSKLLVTRIKLEEAITWPVEADCTLTWNKQ